MKKFLCMILAVLSVFAFASCGENSSEPKNIKTTMFMINAQAFELPQTWQVKMEYDQKTFSLTDENGNAVGKVVVSPITQGGTEPEEYVNKFDGEPTIEKVQYNVTLFKIYDETKTEYHYIKTNLDYAFDFEKSVHQNYINVILENIK